MAVGALAAIVLLVVAGAMLLRGDDDPTPAPARKVAATPRAGCAGPAPGSYQLPVDAEHPPVLLHVPPGTPRARRPVIVMLPGAGQPGSYAEQYTGYSTLADQHGFLVAYPTAAGASAFMTAHMACAAADLLTAAASVSGGYSTLPPCHPGRRLPILEMPERRHGRPRPRPRRTARMALARLVQLDRADVAVLCRQLPAQRWVIVKLPCGG